MGATYLWDAVYILVRQFIGKRSLTVFNSFKSVEQSMRLMHSRPDLALQIRDAYWMLLIEHPLYEATTLDLVTGEGKRCWSA